MPHLESKQKWNFCPAQLSSEFTPTLLSPGWSILSCVDWYLEGEWMAWTLLCRPVPLESAPLPASPSHCKRMGTHLLRLLRAQQSCPCTNPAQCPVSNPHGLHSYRFHSRSAPLRHLSSQVYLFFYLSSNRYLTIF